MMMLLIVFVGGTVDIARQSHARSGVQDAIDTALLSAARAYQTNGGDKAAALRLAQRVYSKAKPARPSLSQESISFQFAADGSSVVALGQAKIRTVFLKIVRIPELSVVTLSQTNSSKVVIGPGTESGSVEISLMLDVTGSMVGKRLADLKDAAKDLIGIMLSDAHAQTGVRIAVVPYAAGVNAGSYVTAVRGAVKQGNCSQPGCQYYTFANALGRSQTLQVTNCVSERTGVNAFTDAPPSVTKLGYSYLAPDNTCPSVAIRPLSSDKALLSSSIDALAGGGSTAAQTGFAWAWYVLAPQWNYLWPASKAGDYQDKAVRKIAVLMTDGEFNSPYCNGAISKDATVGSGSTSDHINCNAPNGNSYAQALKLCAGMKAAGIEVYTVGFDVIDSGSARQVMEQCATSASRAYNAADGGQLRSVFRDIGLKISTVYLSR